ncbi:DUF4157 domain-containing protein [Streptomyces palmae]|uniref:DUF4157 domain-containing protein n=1 Tax=Streptomyces palmae TaxID=1701085 RepID=A0A4Z0H5N2_9ACTN|nr:DUF4157 domain-containing protein [Streptomyces palmae]
MPARGACWRAGCRLAADLRGARIHTGAQANSAAQALGAEAFTSGHHMVFAAGAYAPHTGPGQALLAQSQDHAVRGGTTWTTRGRRHIWRACSRGWTACAWTTPHAEMWRVRPLTLG